LKDEAMRIQNESEEKLKKLESQAKLTSSNLEISTKLLAEKDLKIKNLESKTKNLLSRSRLRNQVIDFDDDVEEKSMFIEPPDIGVNGDGNPSLDFHLGR
jgi:PIN domain nuclease of toxin-antitoxin system